MNRVLLDLWHVAITNCFAQVANHSPEISPNLSLKFSYETTALQFKIDHEQDHPANLVLEKHTAVNSWSCGKYCEMFTETHLSNFCGVKSQPDQQDYVLRCSVLLRIFST